MVKKFEKLRFYLFTKSYAWYILKQQIKRIKVSEIFIDKLSQILLLNKKILTNIFNKNGVDRQISLISKRNKKISIYLQIEHELITLLKQKQNKDSFADDDYHFALFEPAIERVAGNNLSHIKSDHWFDKRLIDLGRKYHRWYYEVAYKYKLPTMRIVPFLLRLLSIS